MELAGSGGEAGGTSLDDEEDEETEKLKELVKEKWCWWTSKVAS